MCRKIFVSVLILYGLAGCQSYDRSSKLILYNKSDKVIHYFVSCDSSVENLRFAEDNVLKPGRDVRPYLLFGPEGKGPKKPWVNAINLGDDSSLYVFFCYIDRKSVV